MDRHKRERGMGNQKWAFVDVGERKSQNVIAYKTNNKNTHALASTAWVKIFYTHKIFWQYFPNHWEF